MATSKHPLIKLNCLMSELSSTTLIFFEHYMPIVTSVSELKATQCFHTVSLQYTSFVSDYLDQAICIFK